MIKRTVLASAIALAPFAAQAQTVEELQQQIDILAKEVESLKQAGNAGSALNKVSIGGYGELHYNNYSEHANDDQIDAHRFVLYFGYDFTDRVRFASEFELEHSLAGDGKPGEVELEQAYIEIDTTANTKLKTGLFLVPVGILNETHEPNTFYGVERNQLEGRVIPTTWWEAGVMFSQDLGGGLSYDIAGHSGLNMYDSGTLDANAIRSGRQKVAEAVANKGAVTGRVRYVGVPGLDLAVSAQHQQDVFQTMGTESVPGTLIEAHARYTVAGATFTVQHAAWDFDEAIGVEAAEDQNGLLVEASYRFNDNWGVFARQTEVDYNAGGSDAENREREDRTFGVNYWVVPQVVFKADYNDVSYDNDALDDDNDDSFNLGVGWSF